MATATSTEYDSAANMRKRPGSRRTNPPGNEYRASKTMVPGAFVPVLRNSNTRATDPKTTAVASRSNPPILVDRLALLKKATGAKAKAGKRYFASAKGCTR
jgi:hypothetical protein